MVKDQGLGTVPSNSNKLTTQRGMMAGTISPAMLLILVLLLVIVVLQIELQNIAMKNYEHTMQLEETKYNHDLQQQFASSSMRRESSSKDETENTLFQYQHQYDEQDQSSNDDVVVEDTQRHVPQHLLDHHAHVLYGMSGNYSGMFDEFEISLKSVLLNAPISFDLTIHVMVDEAAYQMLPAIIEESAELDQWEGRNQITIQIYNVESYLNEWDEYILEQTNNNQMTERHKIGAFFRLFVDRIVDTAKVDHMLYLDTDVIVMSNLEKLWTSNVNLQPSISEDELYFKWGYHECSGFLLLRTSKIQEIWQDIYDLVTRRDDSHKKNLFDKYSEKWHEWYSDQLIFRIINRTKPEVVGILPKEWDVSLGELWANVMKKRPDGVGMFHFNGSGANATGSAFRSGIITSTKPQKRETWGLADFYVRIPWAWARFQAASTIGVNNGVGGGGGDGGGYRLQIVRHHGSFSSPS